MLVAIIMAVVLSSGFYYTDCYMAKRMLAGTVFWSPAHPWDKIFPFSPRWVWIYFLYFPICFIPIFMPQVRQDMEIFRKTALGYLIQFSIALAFFWIIPSYIARPEILDQGISGLALSWFYKIDLGFNVFPSLHVANVAYIALLSGRLINKRFSAALWSLCLLIALSTLFIKQHYLADILGGLLVGIGSYYLSFARRAK